jgi:ABC-type branched-subunit amino acid transport system ATPase component
MEGRASKLVEMSSGLLLLNEPSIVKEALGRIQRLNPDNGVTPSIVEQKVGEVLDICDRIYCPKLDRVTYAGLARIET